MKATVLMRQPGRVQEIVSALRRGGGDRLQVPRGRGGACRSGRLARVHSRVAAGTCKPAALRNGQQAEGKPLVRPFSLGGEPTCPNAYISDFSVRSGSFL